MGYTVVHSQFTVGGKETSAESQCFNTYDLAYAELEKEYSEFRSEDSFQLAGKVMDAKFDSAAYAILYRLIPASASDATLQFVKEFNCFYIKGTAGDPPFANGKPDDLFLLSSRLLTVSRANASIKDLDVRGYSSLAEAQTRMAFDYYRELAHENRIITESCLKKPSATIVCRKPNEDSVKTLNWQIRRISVTTGEDTSSEIFPPDTPAEKEKPAVDTPTPILAPKITVSEPHLFAPHSPMSVPNPLADSLHSDVVHPVLNVTIRTAGADLRPEIRQYIGRQYTRRVTEAGKCFEARALGSLLQLVELIMTAQDCVTDADGMHARITTTELQADPFCYDLTKLYSLIDLGLVAREGTRRSAKLVIPAFVYTVPSGYVIEHVDRAAVYKEACKRISSASGNAGMDAEQCKIAAAVYAQLYAEAIACGAFFGGKGYPMYHPHEEIQKWIGDSEKAYAIIDRIKRAGLIRVPGRWMQESGINAPTEFKR